MLTISLEGDRELIDLLARLPRRLQAEILMRAAAPTAEVIAERARTMAPVLTGRTRAGVRAEVGATAAFVVSSRRPFPMLPLWLERGTRKMEARPYMGPAAALETQMWIARVERVVRDVWESGRG